MKGKSSNMVSKLQLFTLLNMSEQAVRECLSGIVREAAQQAVVPSFKHLNGDIDVSFKSNNDIVTEADVDMQQRINDALNEIWPDIPVLGEEQAAAVQQAILQTGSGAFWVLDPIDGTSNFAFGIPYFCTSLSLVYEHQVQLGLVYDPIRDECFFATRQGGASSMARSWTALRSMFQPSWKTSWPWWISNGFHRFWRPHWLPRHLTVHSAVWCQCSGLVLDCS